jgi:DNA-binding NarL/FixJ family response regulator
MTEERRHRPPLVADAAAAQLRAEAAERRLDREAVGAVLEAAGHHRQRGAWPAGLTDREVEVLRQVARGNTNRQVAEALHISEETARNHVKHIYEKVGVSTRAGAALFAMEQGLFLVDK